ncbi:hypothetical protein [Vampirovibrio sp.]|uniref:hypothetical protein n=1 Tax=Vampirovibrio sp. TaxID=2717857 RepID=UPI0035948426
MDLGSRAATLANIFKASGSTPLWVECDERASNRSSSNPSGDTRVIRASELSVGEFDGLNDLNGTEVMGKRNGKGASVCMIILFSSVRNNVKENTGKTSLNHENTTNETFSKASQFTKNNSGKNLSASKKAPNYH